MNDILFDPIGHTHFEATRPRYYFETDEIEISIITNCDCDECCVDSQEGDSIPGWSILDTKKGHNHPIAFCEDAIEAQKIVDALNSKSR